MVRGPFASELGVDRFLPARLTGCVRHDRNDAMKQSAEPRSPPVHLDTNFARRQRARSGRMRDGSRRTSTRAHARQRMTIMKIFRCDERSRGMLPLYLGNPAAHRSISFELVASGPKAAKLIELGNPASGSPSARPKFGTNCTSQWIGFHLRSQLRQCVAFANPRCAGRANELRKNAHNREEGLTNLLGPRAIRMRETVGWNRSANA
jgi:hypothetical protein